MPRFFTGQFLGERVLITGEDARHMALALRMKCGEQVTVCDNNDRDYQCVITAIHPEQVELKVLTTQASAGEPWVKITLYQALPKGDKLEQIVQKAVELGVCRIVPVLTHRCVSRPDDKSMQKKLLRYQKIAQQAAKQCGRGRIPAIEPLIDFKTAVLQMKQVSLPLFFYENAQTPLKQILRERLTPALPDLAILVGSEGGFEPSEAAFAQEHGLLPLSLGKRILRCETAPLAALAAILYEAGE